MTEQQGLAIDYYVWLSSDWAYLGGVRFVQLAKRHRLKINHIPMRMQDVYAGSGGILLGNRSWQRQAYRITELKRWRSRLGIPVNIEPKFFPCDVDLGLLHGDRRPAAGPVDHQLRQRGDASDLGRGPERAEPGVLIAIADRCGLEGRELLDAADTEPVRSEYRGNTARALAAGVFGSPFFVLAGELFWGQDRLDMLEEAIVRSATGNLGRGPG